MTDKILVVDDNDLDQQIFRDLLESAGYFVDTVNSGEEALKTLKERLDDYKLVILDMFMPGMSGQETLRHIRKLKRELKVMIVSAYLTDITNKVMLGLGARHCLKKPVDRDVLLGAVSDLTEEKSEVNQEASL
ncbi:response regulator [bacterium]|nr:response regulator [FCB group bacterium]MBL7190829.1 response regulator [bacterium]